MQVKEKAALAPGCESDAVLFKSAYCLNSLYISLYSSHVSAPLTYYCESFQTLIENHCIVSNKNEHVTFEVLLLRTLMKIRMGTLCREIGPMKWCGKY